jgi:DMSO/TMAO reductase YedYZ heme-binding membrane subunit
LDFLLNNLAFIIIPFIYISIFMIGKYIVKYQFHFIALAFILSFVFYLIGGQFLEWTVFSGHFSLALFILVMLAGVMKKNGIYRSVIDPVRGDLSLYGFIYLLPHIFLRFDMYINGFNPIGSIAYLLMIPLLVTSIRNVKKNIETEKWQEMHKLGYLVYFLIYIHVGFRININNFEVTILEISWPFHLTLIVYVIIKLLNRFRLIKLK